MTEYALGGFVGHLEIGHDGSPGAPQVVQRPCCDARRLVQLALWPGERRYGMRSIDGEDPVAAGKSRQGFQEGDGEGRQGHLMNAPDLVPGGGDREQGVVAVEAGKL